MSVSSGLCPGKTWNMDKIDDQTQRRTRKLEHRCTRPKFHTTPTRSAHRSEQAGYTVRSIQKGQVGGRGQDTRRSRDFESWVRDARCTSKARAHMHSIPTIFGTLELQVGIRPKGSLYADRVSFSNSWSRCKSKASQTHLDLLELLEPRLEIPPRVVQTVERKFALEPRARDELSHGRALVFRLWQGTSTSGRVYEQTKNKSTYERLDRALHGRR